MPLVRGDRGAQIKICCGVVYVSILLRPPYRYRMYKHVLEYRTEYAGLFSQA